MRVIATAGHVDHGKSTLVRALTGTDPDRLAEEKERGLTIDLGFAGLELPNGERLAFVDVPGHRRFIGNMLAGLGPAPVVMFVVAADQGWQAQSREHLDAVDALGIEHGLLVLTRCGLASREQIDAVRAEALGAISATSLGEVAVVETDAVSGAGVDKLRSALAELVGALPPVVGDAPVRLWVDRSFSVKGAGTVVTGTLAAGTIALGDRLDVGGEPATVRSLQVLGDQQSTVGPVSRVAVALRGVSRDEVPRGTPLLTPGTGADARVIDVRRETGLGWAEASEEVSVHIGSAAVTARVRPLDDAFARLTVEQPLPLLLGDRLIIRDDSASRIHCGATVLDIDPAPFARRGAASRRAEQLSTWRPGRASDIVDDRGVVPVSWLTRVGATGFSTWSAAAADLVSLAARPGESDDAASAETARTTPPVLADSVPVLPGTGERGPDASVGDESNPRAVVHGVAVSAWQFVTWRDELSRAVTQDAADALSQGLAASVVSERIGVPAALVGDVVAAAGLRLERGRVVSADHATSLGGATDAIETLRARLTAHPFDAPEADDLAALGLGARHLATAAERGAILRLRAQPADIVLLPDAPARAMRELAALPQPFTTSQARQALGTTRRVVIPLLEHLDGRGWTRRDGNARSVVR